MKYSKIINLGSFSAKEIENIKEQITQNWPDIKNKSYEFLKEISADTRFSAEKIMCKFPLNSPEGIALMSLSEALLRVPDAYTSSLLIKDKLKNKNWGKILTSNFALSSLTLALKTSSLIFVSDNLYKIFSRAISKTAKTTIKKIGNIFVMGSDIKSASTNFSKFKSKGFNVSFDLLGESARTFAQSESYFHDYINAIPIIGGLASESRNFHDIPNLSVKITALFPNVELVKSEEIEQELIPKLKSLILLCKQHNISLTFDAEEARRLDIYLHIITKLYENKELQVSGLIGVVIQAYQKQANKSLEHIISLAKKYKIKIPIRLVKGAYWDYEIKRSQEQGLEEYPVYTSKNQTDISYLACAKKILDNHKHMIIQFATHNAITIASILNLSGNKEFEFQKLHGMGDCLHEQLLKMGYKSRVYAPVGEHKDLLAYLMRRLLENGAGNSFVKQAQLHEAQFLIHNPFEVDMSNNEIDNDPRSIYANRKSAKGFELGYKKDLDFLNEKLAPFFGKTYEVFSIIGGNKIKTNQIKENYLPANNEIILSKQHIIDAEEIKIAIINAKKAFNSWKKTNLKERADLLKNLAQNLEEKEAEFISCLIEEGGKTINDAIAELREAIDFCRYYALQANEIMNNPKTLPSVTGEENSLSYHPKGTFLCISPWNFPLAIFLGQIVAALVTGNCVIAKPAEQTPVIAYKIINLMHEIGFPKSVIQLILAKGSTVGTNCVSNPEIDGIVFTGSTYTAKIIQKTLADRPGAIIPLIAETGGLNVMVVDSSCLLEQAADDIILSAFGSAGQRCSALRILCVQEEIYEPLLELIKGSVNKLKISNPTDFSVDIGPIIDGKSKQELLEYVSEKQNKVIFEHENTAKIEAQNGNFVTPKILEVKSLGEVEREVFGPILHVVKYKANDFEILFDKINSSQYGLTFGLHTRIDSRIENLNEKIDAGNIYVNRTMIGAVVGSQPFGGEKESGTGFKAGGPNYLLRFLNERVVTINKTAIGGNIELLA